MSDDLTGMERALIVHEIYANARQELINQENYKRAIENISVDNNNIDNTYQVPNYSYQTSNYNYQESSYNQNEYLENNKKLKIENDNLLKKLNDLTQQLKQYEDLLKLPLEEIAKKHSEFKKSYNSEMRKTYVYGISHLTYKEMFQRLILKYNIQLSNDEFKSLKDVCLDNVMENKSTYGNNINKDSYLNNLDKKWISFK